jgi:hypothetical protein
VRGLDTQFARELRLEEIKESDSSEWRRKLV